MTARAYPLAWPDGWTRTANRLDGRHHFKRGGGSLGGPMREVTVTEAQKQLHDELAKMRAQYVVVSSNLHVRRDGLIGLANFTPSDPGVALYFTYKGRQMAMACDRFDTVAANLRSLGLAIEAIRQLDRH